MEQFFQGSQHWHLQPVQVWQLFNFVDQAGTHFDEEVVKAFAQMMEDNEKYSETVIRTLDQQLLNALIKIGLTSDIQKTLVCVKPEVPNWKIPSQKCHCEPCSINFKFFLF